MTGNYIYNELRRPNPTFHFEIRGVALMQSPCSVYVLIRVLVQGGWVSTQIGKPKAKAMRTATASRADESLQGRAFSMSKIIPVAESHDMEDAKTRVK